MSKQCASGCKLASFRLKQLDIAFSCKIRSFRVNMFKTYIRPILEYSSQVWSPYLVRDIDKIERIQRRFTKSLPGLSNLSYLDRLKELDTNTLEDFFDNGSSRTRGHRYKIYVKL